MSNALDKSKNTDRGIWPLSKYRWIPSTNSMAASSVEWICRKPHWPLYNMFYFERQQREWPICKRADNGYVYMRNLWWTPLSLVPERWVHSRYGMRWLAWTIRGLAWGPDLMQKFTSSNFEKTIAQDPRCHQFGTHTFLPDRLIKPYRVTDLILDLLGPVVIVLFFNRPLVPQMFSSNSVGLLCWGKFWT